jgi:rare lipoprotein A
MLRYRDIVMFSRPDSARLRAFSLIRGFVLLIVLSACLAGCGGATQWKDDSDQRTQKVTKTQKRSSRGNPPFYEVFGERYYVLNTSSGYKERGIASWYGKKFHGKPTSSGEIYDMHAMTAAHKTLPIPTDVRVTNLRNGKSIIVTVNDRGPFVDSRIIDLSHSAAQKLDMISAGTAFVEVETFTGNARKTSLLTDTSDQPAVTKTAVAIANPISSAAAEPTMDTTVIRLYLQVGAFGERLNAQKLQQQLSGHGISNVVIHYDEGREPALYRVRLGPISNVKEYDSLVERVGHIHIKDTHLVTETVERGTTDLSASEMRGLLGG